MLMSDKEKSKTAIEFKLRKLEASDAVSFAKYANNPLVAQNLRDVFPNPYTLEDAAGFISFCQSLDAKEALTYCIDIGGQAVGCISVTKGKDVYSKSAEIGYWLGQEYWGHGIVTRAVKQICSEAFEKLDIVRIHAEIFASNLGSRAVLVKSGFVQEGVLRSAVFKNGRIQDALAFALIKQ